MTHRPEREIKQDILIELSQHPRFMAWNHPTGVARTMTANPYVVRYGLPGSGDIIGLVSITIKTSDVGRSIAIPVSVETKTEVGRLSEQQRRFAKRFTEVGGIYLPEDNPDDIANRLIRLAEQP